MQSVFVDTGGWYASIVRKDHDHHIAETIKLFRNRPDKCWSFTDCSSFVLMQYYKIQTAFTFDVHFHQAGFKIKP